MGWAMIVAGLRWFLGINAVLFLVVSLLSGWPAGAAAMYLAAAAVLLPPFSGRVIAHLGFLSRPWVAFVSGFALIIAGLAMSPLPTKPKEVADQVAPPSVSPSAAKKAPDPQPSPVPPPSKPIGTPAAKPAQTDVRSKIAQYAVVPIQGSGWTKTIQEWGDDWIRRINLAMPRVAEHVAKSPTCDVVETVGISSRSTPRQSAVFYVDCRNNERFYVAEAELGGAAPTSKNSQTARISDDSAIVACVDQVKEQLTVPLSFERHRLSTKVYRSPYGNIAVDFNFSVKNQLGGSIPQHARCVIDDTGIHPAEISAQ